MATEFTLTDEQLRTVAAMAADMVREARRSKAASSGEVLTAVPVASRLAQGEAPPPAADIPVSREPWPQVEVVAYADGGPFGWSAPASA